MEDGFPNCFFLFHVIDCTTWPFSCPTEFMTRLTPVQCTLATEVHEIIRSSLRQAPDDLDVLLLQLRCFRLASYLNLPASTFVSSILWSLMCKAPPARMGEILVQMVPVIQAFVASLDAFERNDVLLDIIDWAYGAKPWPVDRVVCLLREVFRIGPDLHFLPSDFTMLISQLRKDCTCDDNDVDDDNDDDDDDDDDDEDEGEGVDKTSLLRALEGICADRHLTEHMDGLRGPHFPKDTEMLTMVEEAPEAPVQDTTVLTFAADETHVTKLEHTPLLSPEEDDATQLGWLTQTSLQWCFSLLLTGWRWCLWQWTNPERRVFVYMAINVTSSVCIVFINKWLVTEFLFEFGVSLKITHFVVTFFGLWLCSAMDVFEVKHLHFKDVLPLAISFLGFIVFTDLSLQYNSVQFYQVVKTMVTPTILLLQYFMYGIVVDVRITLALVPVAIGTMITSVTDFETSILGTFIGLIGVVMTAFYQILCAMKHQDLNANSMQLLFYQVPLASVGLLLICPMVDNVQDLQAYRFSLPVVGWIALSAILSFFVNLSIFQVIGNTSPLTYNILCEFKGCLVILGGFILFKTPIEKKNICGILVTLLGVAVYIYMRVRYPAFQGEHRYRSSHEHADDDVPLDALRPFAGQD